MKPTRARFFALSLLLAASTASAGGPELSIDPPALDWGTISPGERIERRFSLTNTGQKELVIEEVSTSCRCLSASLSKEIIPPGGAAELVVSFDPTGWSGGFTGFVVLRTNDPLRPVRRIEVKGRIAPATGEIPEEAGAEADSADVEAPAEAGPPPPIPSSEGSGEGEPHSGGPSAPTMLREKEEAGEGKVRVLFFYSAHCPECLAIKDRFLPAFLHRHPEVEIVSYDLDAPDGYRAFLGWEEMLGQRLAAAPPVMIVGKRALLGAAEIEEHLEEAIRESDGALPVPVLEDRISASAGFRRLSLAAVVLGGLLDGINPCAFATLIFLLTYLILVGEDRRLVMMGLCFAAGVFVGYLLIGLGLLELIGRIQALPAIHRIFRLGLAVFLFFLGLASLRDAWLIHRGRAREAILQLPDGLKRRIHAAIRERMRGRAALGGSLAMGFLVALLEFPCTGQVYFPVVAVIREGGEGRFAAFGYLLLYNLLFIAPLFGLIILVRLGFTSARLAGMARARAGMVKFLMGLFFFGLAGILLWLGTAG
ncbi:MAG: DUF1573 domain-containing protein [Firmicutes bacterium]|nr:DUF1573 domain-containing protein [Bacillota bacterium]